MLTDRERQTWREIQRRVVEDSDFKRTFHAVERQGPGDHLRPPHHRTVLVTLALAMLLLVGPNLLTDDEVADRQQPPTPQESSALGRLGAGEYMTGVEWAPARETQWLVGPSDTDPFRSLDAPVATPPSGFAPSAAA
ncbi:MAG: hypothetical protein ACRDQF_08295 [Thermocrispum sp.]